MNPLVAPPPAEVPLPSAPLVRVITQIRFPLIASLQEQTFIAPFQEAIRKHYPVLRPERAESVLLEAGTIQQGASTVWRFSDAAGEWRASLSSDFVALETTAYRSRADFLDRLSELVTALQVHVAPGVADRIGVRYIDRVVGADLEELRGLVRPEVLGVVATDLGEAAEWSITETQIQFEKGKMTLRWGHLPPLATHDPMAVEPVAEQSWVLDIDSFTTGQTVFDATTVIEVAQHLAEKAYSLFRWAVKDAFLKRYGGEV